MAAKPGIDAAFYRNTGNWNTPTWNEVEIVNELNPGTGWDTAEIKTRQSPVKFGAKTLLDLAFTVKVLCDDSDANYTAFMTSFQSKTNTIDMMVLDASQNTNNAFGVRALFQIAEGQQPQPLDDVLYREFKCVPYPDPTFRPQWVTVTNSAPVFTNIT